MSAGWPAPAGASCSCWSWPPWSPSTDRRSPPRRATRCTSTRSTRAGYKERNGHWAMLDVPEDMQVNAIHAALLRTGKVLLIAGSGNDREQFDAGEFETLLWDPKTDEFRKIAHAV